MERNQTFEALSAFTPWQPAATGRGETERLDGQRVSAAFFDVRGVTLVLGRAFDPADDRPGGSDVVILSYGLWQRRYGGDSTIIGRHMQLDGSAFRVLAVMAREFDNVPPHPAHAWTLLQYDASLPSFEAREWGRHLDVVGRVKVGFDTVAAANDLGLIATNPIPELARPTWASMDYGLSIRSLKEAVTAGSRPLLLALLGAVRRSPLPPG